MDSSLLGVVLDSSVLITAERKRASPEQVLEEVQVIVGEVPIVLCSLTVAEVGHGIYRANSPDIIRHRRNFLDTVQATIPIYPITVQTAEIIARIGGEQAAKGTNIPLGDLIIGACALELGYAVATGNVKDFQLIPGLNVIRL